MLLIAGLAGCRGATATRVASGDTPEPRRPDGVVLDPPPAIPLAADRTSARGVIALREPLGDEAMTDLVRAFVAAFTREDVEGLLQLLTTDAVGLDAKGPKTRASMVDAWRARFRNLDYARLGGTEIIDIDTIERYTAPTLGGGSAPARPPEMRDSDILLRIPITVPRVAGERYFGDAFVMLIRRDGERYKIAALSEEDAP